MLDPIGRFFLSDCPPFRELCVLGYAKGQIMEEKFRELKELMLLGEIDGDELIRRYRAFADIDDEKALTALRQRLAAELAGGQKPAQTVKVTLWRRYRYAVAAAAVVIVVLGGILLLRQRGTGVPAISEEVQLAMEQSSKLGKQEADVTVLAPDAIAEAVSKNSAKAESFAAARQVTTEQTKEYWLTLDDGTVVHLNNDTYLIYPEKKDAGTREVILDGEAYFMVAKDAERQFVVHTKQGDVKVYGTEFNVSTREEDGATEVVLVEGSVSVTPTGGAECRIEPGQKATMGETLTVETVDVEQYVAWNTGRFSFQDWPLSRIMTVIAKWYGISVAFADESLGEPRLSGNFDRYEDLSTTIESLEMVTGLQFDLTEESIFIHKH